MGDISQAITGAPSAIAAAERLGVHRATVYRWEEADRAPGGCPRALPPDVRQSPAEWAATMRRDYVLDASQAQLVMLGEVALGLAQDTAHAAPTRLLAAGRFQAITKQLERCEGVTPTASPIPTTPRTSASRKRRRAADPRVCLETVNGFL
jgi:hypothetical protein